MRTESSQPRREVKVPLRGVPALPPTRTLNGLGSAGLRLRREFGFENRRISQPISPAVNDPSRMPTFTSFWSSTLSAKASRPMNRLMVKPMPHSSDDAEQLRPARPRGQVGEAEADDERGAPEHADQLAEQQAERDAERQAVGQRVRGHARERHAGIGEAEDRDHDERRPSRGARAPAGAAATGRMSSTLPGVGFERDGQRQRDARRASRGRPTGAPAPRARRRAAGRARAA